jgi:hypothetical protein
VDSFEKGASHNFTCRMEEMAEMAGRGFKGDKSVE